MASTQRPESHPTINSFTPPLPPSSAPLSESSTAATSPVEPPPSAGQPRATLAPSVNGASPTALSGFRTSSPSHDYAGRLYPKRYATNPVHVSTANSKISAREIQAQEGITPQIWGPPTSGNSTPLRDSIPESPHGDNFPDFAAQPDSPGSAPSQFRGRTRAGTLPSRFTTAGSPGLLNPTVAALTPKTSRPTPSTSPFKPGSTTPEVLGFAAAGALANKATLLQRLRAGSMPQRANAMPANPFGPSLYSSTWMNRDRTNTLASIRSSEGATSPVQSTFSRESLADNDVKTLDYLGLVDTPKQHRASLVGPDMATLINQQANVGLSPQTIADLAAFSKNANRFRSYSVNAKEKYADDDDDMGSYGGYSGAMTPDGNAAISLHEMVRQHNLEVQAFASFANATRPRARTAGVLEQPSSRMLRNYMPTPSRLDNSLSAADLRLAEEAEYSGLEAAVEQMHLKAAGFALGDVDDGETPTRALWLGNIPSSTTVSSLSVIFSPFGTIESARVLTHKNCGFVNFETLENAVNARSHLNGKEIFPGAGPVRIGYAKVPSASATPGANGVDPSPSPDPQKNHAEVAKDASAAPNKAADHSASSSLELVDIKSEILSIVKELGATEEDQQRISASIDEAIEHNNYEAEIPPIPEPSHNRVHDAPRLREIRKRIDNNTCTPQEIEDVAVNMLDEISELSSDYLGNTVVQKLFEFCSESVKGAMLERIAPHLAEIGVHKNGTWAAQKIIDVARTPALMEMVAESLRPYSMALFLDQFGNYVMQGCLRYQFPVNNFIFEVMLNRLWDLAQGRFGARAMRACLESHYATKDQQRMIAATIAMHSVQLATNANGALLLTWFLDTCTFPRRRTVLAPRLVPHLVRLCTHKVAYLTVLKIINQRNEPEARDTILQALFFSQNDRVLEDILSDQQCGATLMFKVLTTPFFDEGIRPEVLQNVRSVLVRIKAQPQQGYKRLMDEVGLSTRSGGGRDAHNNREDSARPTSRHSNVNHTPQPVESPMSRPYYPNMQPAYEPAMNMQRTGSMDSGSFDSYAPPATYPTSMPPAMAPMAPHQMQFHHPMMAPQARPPPAYYPQVAVNQGGYPAGAPDPYRGPVAPIMMNSAMMPGFGAPPGFGMAGGQGMFPAYPMQFVAPGMAAGPMAGHGRRRVG
jgi:protein JSN1